MSKAPKPQKSIMKIKAGAGTAIGRLQKAAAQAKKGK